MTGRAAVLAVLLLMAVIYGVRALLVVELRTFNVAISGFALLLAAIVRVMKEPIPKLPPVRREASAARRRAGQWMAIGGAAASIAWWSLAPWVPRIEFDVVGFLYLVHNFWQSAVMLALLALTGIGVMFWSGR